MSFVSCFCPPFAVTQQPALPCHRLVSSHAFLCVLGSSLFLWGTDWGWVYQEEVLHFQIQCCRGTESAENTAVTPKQGLSNHKTKRASVALEVTAGYLRVKVPQGGLEPLKETGPHCALYPFVATSPEAGSCK